MPVIDYEQHLGQVGGWCGDPADTIVRPADTNAYASGDVLGSDTGSGPSTVLEFARSARVPGGSGVVRRVRARKTGVSITNATGKLHLYSELPVPANGDNGAFSTDKCLKWLGSFDVTFNQVFSDGAAGNGVPSVGSDIQFHLADGEQSLFGVWEWKAAYTPGSAESFEFTLEILQN